LALINALADIFVPSIATNPGRRRPDRAHSPSTPENTSPSARSCRRRNSAIVEWSGATLPATTRKTTSSMQPRSMPREDRTPRAYA
jgi:hypothetical protein